MSPEQRQAITATARLRREIAHDRQALARHEEDGRELLATWAESAGARSTLAHTAVVLHAWYTGLETIFERIARQLDGDVPNGDSSHRDLLFQAISEIPSVRPPIMPASLLDPLTELLGFRHFFRHAYAVDLDPSRLVSLLKRLEQIAPQASRALDGFDAFLLETMAEIQQ